MSKSYKEYDNQILNKLHGVELEIMDEIDRICRKHNISYFLCGGSMLGCIRHSGFIPWDDDIDVGMMRSDYDKFISVCKSELDSKYFLDNIETNDLCYLFFSKIRKNNTIFNEANSKNVNNHKGIFVDIFPFDNCGKPSKLGLIRAFFIQQFMFCVQIKSDILNISDVKHKLFCRFLLLFPKKLLIKLNLIFSKFNKNDNSLYVTCFYGYGYRKETLRRDVFLPVKDYEFEDRCYMGMNKYHDYLSSLYKDYMKLPPLDKRVNHVSEEIVFDTREK